MVVEIDGSILEGGGQILRMSIALSVLRKTPVRIYKIRANRKNGGLAAQHLTGIRLAKDICQGELENDALGSTDITFIPSHIVNGKFLADTKTAGCVETMVALPCILFAADRSYLTLKGGTNADLAPQIDYTVNVFRPMLQKFGANFDYEIVKRGFFQGNGVVNVTVNPVKKLLPVDLTNFGEVESIQGEAFVAGVLPLRMAEEMAQASIEMLKKHGIDKVSIKPVKFKNFEAFGNGSGINLTARTTTNCYLGSSNLGKKGISTREVGAKAAEILLDAIENKICVDQKLQDQLILFMALAEGKSKIKVGPITSHTETAIHFCKLLTNAKFNIIKLDDHRNIIECDGIGQQNVFI